MTTRFPGVILLAGLAAACGGQPPPEAPAPTGAAPAPMYALRDGSPGPWLPVDPAMVGSWSGTAKQQDGTNWTMEVVLHAEAQEGGIGGEVLYPSLDCGGFWRRRGGESREPVFEEELGFGQDRCLDHGAVRLTYEPEGDILRFEYVHPEYGAPARATAALSRE